MESKKQKPFFVYLDWTTKNPKRIYYVGYGDDHRIGRKKRNIHHDNIMKKHGLQREVVFVAFDEEVAKKLEIRLIAEHQTCVYAKDYIFGTNYTFGGDGQRGRITGPISKEHKLILSKANSKPKSQKTKQLMKVAAMKRANDPSWRKKMSEVSLRRWQNSEYRLKFIKATTGKKRTPEQCARLKEASKKLWLSEEHRNKNKAGCRFRYSKEEEHTKARERMTRLWRDPNYRKNRKHVYRKKIK